jgi:hypothetical protein
LLPNPGPGKDSVDEAGPAFDTVPAAVDGGNTIYTRDKVVDDNNGEFRGLTSRDDTSLEGRGWMMMEWLGGLQVWAGGN